MDKLRIPLSFLAAPRIDIHRGIYPLMVTESGQGYPQTVTENGECEMRKISVGDELDVKPITIQPSDSFSAPSIQKVKHPCHSVPSTELLSFPLARVAELPLATSLVCADSTEAPIQDCRAMVFTGSTTVKLHAMKVQGVAVFGSMETTLIALSVENDRASSFREWVEYKYKDPEWVLTEWEALGGQQSFGTLPSTYEKYMIKHITELTKEHLSTGIILNKLGLVLVDMSMEKEIPLCLLGAPGQPAKY